MADFLQFCNQFSPLTEEAKDELFKNIRTKTVHKGEYLLKTGEVCRHFLLGLSPDRPEFKAR